MRCCPLGAWTAVARLVKTLAAGLDERVEVEVAEREYESARVLLARAEKAGWRWENLTSED